MKKTRFKIRFSDDCYQKGDILIDNNNIEFKITSTPKRSWWKVLFQILSFGIYKPSVLYAVKRIKDK